MVGVLAGGWAGVVGAETDGVDCAGAGDGAGRAITPTDGAGVARATDSPGSGLSTGAAPVAAPGTRSTCPG